MNDDPVNRGRSGRAGQMRSGRPRAAVWEGDAAAEGRRGTGRRRNQRLRAEITPAWSDDAFERLFGDEGDLEASNSRRDDPRAASPRSGVGDVGQDGPGGFGDGASLPRQSQQGQNQQGENQRAPGPAPREEPFRRQDAPGEPPEEYGTESDPYDLDPRDEDEEEWQSDRREMEPEEGLPGEERPYRSGRSRDRFADRVEPRLAVGGSGGTRPPLSDEAWIARRFAPEPIDFDEEAWREDRQEKRRGRGGYYAAAAAACVLLAGVFVGPDLVRTMSSSTPSSFAEAPAPDARAPVYRLDSPLAPAVDPAAQGRAGAAGEGSGAGMADVIPPSPGAQTVVPLRSVPAPPPLDDASQPVAGLGGVSEAPVSAPSAPAGSAATANDTASGSAPSGRSDGGPFAGVVPPTPPSADERDPARARPQTQASAESRAADVARSASRAGDAAAIANAAAAIRPEVITATGQMVVLVQAELRKRGYDPGRVDGRAGEKTRDAIRAFKRDAGIESDGGIDDQLLERLGIVGRRLTPFSQP